MHKDFFIFAPNGAACRAKSSRFLCNVLFSAVSDRKCDKYPVRLLSHRLCYTGVTAGGNNKNPSQIKIRPGGQPEMTRTQKSKFFM